MNATYSIKGVSPIPVNHLSMEGGGLIELCEISHETEERHYAMLLWADTAELSLEGLNRYVIALATGHLATDLQEKLRITLEINLREEMNCIHIEQGKGFYFTITRKSLDLSDPEIDSSIHEVVDLGLMEHRVKVGATGKARNRDSMLFDPLACNLLKAAVSTLVAQSTRCHREVIRNADHLFASRQDYLRDMCNCMTRNAAPMADSVTGKALHCDLGLF